MSREGVGRLLTVSLHQAIGDVIPDRLEYYEEWLRPENLHGGRVGRAPLVAVLSFLRREAPPVYDQVVARAGAYAGAWRYEEFSGLRRAALRAGPTALRRRLAMRAARDLVRATFHGSRAVVRWRGGAGRVELAGSLFCDVREPAVTPLCGFYAAAIGHLLETVDAPAQVRTTDCRAVGDGACAITITSS